MRRPDRHTLLTVWKSQGQILSEGHSAIAATLGGERIAWGGSATDLAVRLLGRLRPKILYIPEVFCPTFVHAVEDLVERVVYVPLEGNGWGWDVERVEWKEGVAIQTHLLGNKSLAPPKCPGLIVVEDCCHSGKSFNTHADYHLFSANAYKPVDLGGGGILTTSKNWLPQDADECENHQSLAYQFARIASTPSRWDPSLNVSPLDFFESCSGSAWAAWSEFKKALYFYMLRNLEASRHHRLTTSHQYRSLPGWIECEFAIAIGIDDSRAAGMALWKDHGFEYLEPFEAHTASAKQRLARTLFLPTRCDWEAGLHEARKESLTTICTPRGG